MEAPEKIYVVGMKTSKEQEGFVGFAYEYDNLLIAPTEYIRQDIHDETIKIAEDHAMFAGREKMREELLEWAESMKRICKGAEPIEKAFQTVIEKIKKL